MSTTEESGTSAAGTHLLADFWDTRTIDSVEELDALVRTAVASAGATLIELAFHRFPASGPGAEPGAGSAPGTATGGITGYALLAESHISVHTWPERGYVAIDVFMCGDQRPETALEVMRRAFAPAREQVHALRRGIEPLGESGKAGSSAAGSSATGSGAAGSGATSSCPMPTRVAEPRAAGPG